MAWFKSFEGISSDPKWPVIARKAGVNVGTVVSIWMALLDHASQSTPRGRISGFDCETIDALYGYEDGICQRVLEALAQKGLLDGESIANWEKRQTVRKRENSESGDAAPKTNAERQRD